MADKKSPMSGFKWSKDSPNPLSASMDGKPSPNPKNATSPRGNVAAAAEQINRLALSTGAFPKSATLGSHVQKPTQTAGSPSNSWSAAAPPIVISPTRSSGGLTSPRGPLATSPKPPTIVSPSREDAKVNVISPAKEDGKMLAPSRPVNRVPVKRSDRVLSGRFRPVAGGPKQTGPREFRAEARKSIRFSTPATEEKATAHLTLRRGAVKNLIRLYNEQPAASQAEAKMVYQYPIEVGGRSKDSNVPPTPRLKASTTFTPTLSSPNTPNTVTPPSSLPKSMKPSIAEASASMLLSSDSPAASPRPRPSKAPRLARAASIKVDDKMAIFTEDHKVQQIIYPKAAPGITSYTKLISQGTY
ncbi:mucin 6, oligomeric mucus/gel-forming, partial [Planoprotostelium fungivorum]